MQNDTKLYRWWYIEIFMDNASLDVSLKQKHYTYRNPVAIVLQKEVVQWQ